VRKDSIINRRLKEQHCIYSSQMRSDGSAVRTGRGHGAGLYFVHRLLDQSWICRVLDILDPSVEAAPFVLVESRLCSRKRLMPFRTKSLRHVSRVYVSTYVEA
jgi:hypothetical protein